MNEDEQFWQASVEELKQGYIYNEENRVYSCLICGCQYEQGVIYPNQGVLYEAEKAMRVHLSTKHVSMFDYLLNLDKKITGLTEHQKQILSCFHQGLSDRETMVRLGIGSASTIRNHRFALKQKEKQARIFLALMELLAEKVTPGAGIPAPASDGGHDR